MEQAKQKGERNNGNFRMDMGRLRRIPNNFHDTSTDSSHSRCNFHREILSKKEQRKREQRSVSRILLTLYLLLRESTTGRGACQGDLLSLRASMAPAAAGE